MTTRLSFARRWTTRTPRYADSRRSVCRDPTRRTADSTLIGSADCHGEDDTMRYRTRLTHAKWMLGAAGVLAVAVGLVLHPSTEAQDRPIAVGPSIAPNVGTEIAVPEIRTIADMHAAAA